LLTTVGTIYILLSAVILQCLKDFYQEDLQKNNLFIEKIIYISNEVASMATCLSLAKGLLGGFNSHIYYNLLTNIAKLAIYRVE
jgi:uncharacterized metal-binding protein